MKIAMVYWPLSPIGGLATMPAALTKGLIAAGCEVDWLNVRWVGKTAGRKEPGKPLEVLADGVHRVEGDSMHFRPDLVIPYKGDAISAAIERLQQYDGIIWPCPVPTVTVQNVGNTQWRDLLESVASKSLLFVVDCNLPKRYPYLSLVCEKVLGLIHDHETSWVRTEALRARRYMIWQPHWLDNDLPEEEFTYDRWIARLRGAFSCASFKTSKKVETFIAAIPHLEKGTYSTLAGGGRELMYMKSLEDSLRIGKHMYLTEDRSTTLWSLAVASGMNFLGWAKPELRDAMMQNYRVFVDPAAPTQSTASHVNNTDIEALRNGAVPVLNKDIMEGELVRAYMQYIPMHSEDSPSKRAASIMEAINLDKNGWLRIREGWVGHTKPLVDAHNQAAEVMRLFREAHRDPLHEPTAGWQKMIEEGERIFDWKFRNRDPKSAAAIEAKQPGLF